MKRASILFSVLGIILLLMGACAPKIRMAAPSMAAPPPPPAAAAPMLSVSRYAVIEDHFETIANSFDREEIISNIEALLEMSESDTSSVRIYEDYVDEENLFLTLSIREYIDVLLETKFFDDRIEEVSYNIEGKIQSIILIWYLDEEEEDGEGEFEFEEDEGWDEEAWDAEEADSQMMMAMPSTSRYAPIEKHFKTIADSEDLEEVLSSKLEILEMCESGESRVEVFHYDAEKFVMDTTIRGYIESIHEAHLYQDEIDDVTYNSDGKITLMNLFRY